MSVDREFARLLQAEEMAEATRLDAHRREARRCAGVAWSGLGPDALARREPAALRRAAASRLAAVRDWRSSAPGRLLAAMAEAERAVETVRASLARGLACDDRRCLGAIADLTRAACSAMDATAPAVLSDGPCATNTASSSPSTASRTNSRA
jgi:hypothetical protein